MVDDVRPLPAQATGGLPRPFNRMWYSTVASSFADGMVITATPLLGVRLTDDPFLISLLSAMSFLPWLIFAIGAGIVVDRVNRRLVLALSNVARLAVIGALAAVVGWGQPGIWLLLGCSFVMGAAETLSDSASVALMPTLAGRGQLDRANARIQGAQVVVRQFVAAPASAWLFGALAAWPFALGAASYGMAALLALAIPAAALKVAAAASGRRESTCDVAGGSSDPGVIELRAADAADPIPGRLPGNAETGALAGLRFLWRHPRLRPLWICSTLTAAGTMFAQATAVLLVLTVLQVPEQGYGLVLACTAIGGLVGVVTARRLSARLGRGTALLTTAVVSGGATIAVGLAPVAALGVIAWSVQGWGIGIWNVLSMSARQQLMPTHLMGRVHGVWRTVMWGIIPLASAMGGLVSRWSLRGVWVIGGAWNVLAALLFAGTLLSFNRADAPDVLQD